MGSAGLMGWRAGIVAKQGALANRKRAEERSRAHIRRKLLEISHAIQAGLPPDKNWPPKDA